jgi:excisionase family DNA binding protein
MTYTIKQAAEATGKTKPTILRAIQRGKISARKDDHGEWEIDPAELHRVYEPVVNGTAPRTDTGDEAAEREVELLQARLAAAEIRLAEKDAQIEALNRRLDAADEERRTTLRQLTALLTDQRSRTAAADLGHEPTQAPSKRRWWQFDRRE